ncbi:glycosyltransferase family 39 protein [Candidatus Woesearchaeota archaeon]|nr:glycosyltransferase family 39 protein [Candidatus Woesearchaeota archaeon]
MNKIFIRKKEQYFDWLFILVAILSAISRIFSFSVESDMWWDSSVYIGMGKHIYSFGQSGLWEASRPLGWPLMLGFFWKIGLDPILFGKITVGLASLGCIILTYLISSKLFGRKTAFFAGLFLAFSPTFFLFGNILYSEIISTFFLLAGIYFFVARKHAFAGLFLGISFITRFFQIFSIIPVIFAYLYCLYKKKYSVKNIIVFAASFLAPVLPYLLLNLYLYGNIFYPFQLQAFMTKYTGWIYHQGIYFYFIGLAKENFVSIFSIIGIITIFRSKDAMKKSFALMLLLPFLPYILASHKEMRILIPILPFLYIAAGIGLLYFAKLFKKHINLALAIILALSIFQVAPQLRFDRL